MMQVHRDLARLPEFRNAVITIGTFDGVHKGHQQIINQLKATAAAIGGETVIITFHPHPRKIVGNYGGNVALLNTLDEKIMLLNEAGIHHLVVVPFTEVFANQSAEAYCKDFIYQYFKPSKIIIGYDHRFGKNRSGDYHLLEKMSEILGFEVIEINAQILNEITVSSTKVRQALLEHDITTANQLLGYPYFFEGAVVKGNQLGRTIGYPTANIAIATEEKLIPANGVYAVIVSIVNSQQSTANSHKGMMNIGIRPTIDGGARVIEVNIFDFNEDIYDQTIQVHIQAYIRGEVKFNGLDALKNQLKEDAVQAKELLA
ncbi:bifunctional riboflavin kinase/FAD synthetase [Parasediminibacterium paludis]|uniref:Riboflavin biosynthesis protein n=1 Tax=Parasediminibacterium paludis TaxID=908966 RepID=A0ABV8Q081_9BACT